MYLVTKHPIGYQNENSFVIIYVLTITAFFKDFDFEVDRYKLIEFVYLFDK